MQKYTLANLDCPTCALDIEEKLNNTPGIQFANVDFATSQLKIDSTGDIDLAEIIEQVDPSIRLVPSKEAENQRKTIGDFLRRFTPVAVAVVLFALGLVVDNLSQQTTIAWIFYIAAYFLSGGDVLVKALKNIRRGLVFDEHFLMSLATLGAMAIGEAPEAVGVMVFYKIGEILEEIAVGKSRQAISDVLDTKVEMVNVLRGDDIELTAPEDVNVGDLVLVRPGEKVPLDGVIQQGESSLDTSALTGESIPCSVAAGDHVLAGMINLDSAMTVRVTKKYEDSSLARMRELIENATSRKAKAEKFIARFARVYTPIVVILATIVAVIPPLLGLGPFRQWLYRAFVVLVISCPCALVLSIPLGYFAGLGAAARIGLFVKGSTYLEILSRVRRVIFDKTGTLTNGKLTVLEVAPVEGLTREELLFLAANAEKGSAHPVARALTQAVGNKAALGESTVELEEVRGKGIKAKLNGTNLVLGKKSLLEDYQIEVEEKCLNREQTGVYVGIDNKYGGCIHFQDELKETVPSAVAALRSVGVEELIILSGDKEHPTRLIADNLGFDCYHAELYPDEKYRLVESHGEGKAGYTAFVGDGINDGPALAVADIGIAMGELGTDLAIETADAIIMNDDIATLAEGIRISRRTQGIIWQNIIFALLVKILFIGLGISGDTSMWGAVFADVGVALITVINAMRVLFVRK